MTVSNSDLPGRIVVVDDDPTVADVVGRYLVRDGHTVECVHDGYEALRRIAEHQPDLVVLDLMLPGIDGLEVCRRLREQWPIPVVMLTALGDETDRLAGFEIGADDYVTKPFSPRELGARIKAVLRRTATREPPRAEPETLRRGGISIDLARREVACRDAPVALTATEFRILHFLAQRPGRVFSRSEIIDGALGRDLAVLDRTVDVHVMALRRKLGDCGEVIETVHGFGYRFQEGERE